MRSSLEEDLADASGLVNGGWKKWMRSPSAQVESETEVLPDGSEITREWYENMGGHTVCRVFGSVPNQPFEI